MFSITEQTARLQVTNRLEKHGPSNVPAMTLRLTFRAPNDILSEVDSTLKSSLYRRPHPGENDMADEADERMQDPNYLPRLRHPKMKNKVVIDEKIVGAEFTLHYGLGGPSNTVLDDVKVDNFQFDPQDGGTVECSIDIDMVPSEMAAGRIFMQNGQDVVFSVTPPEEPQASLSLDQ